MISIETAIAANRLAVAVQAAGRGPGLAVVSLARISSSDTVEAA